MKSVVALLALAAFAAAAPQYRPLVLSSTVRPEAQLRVTGAKDDSLHAVILRYDSDNIGVDGYSYAVETSDGQAKEEQGQLINPGQENESIAVRGQYSYLGPDGVVYSVSYLADDNGFQPQGAHLPVAP